MLEHEDERHCETNPVLPIVYSDHNFSYKKNNMKTIPLTKTSEKVTADGIEREVEIDTKQLIRTAVNYTPEKGFDVQQMMDRLKILEALDKTNGAESLELEDADYNNLSGYVKQVRWAYLSKEIVSFIKQFG